MTNLWIKQECELGHKEKSAGVFTTVGYIMAAKCKLMLGTCSSQRWRTAWDRGWGLGKGQKIYKIIVLLMKKLQFENGTQN